jgi:hypothetical protein
VDIKGCGLLAGLAEALHGSHAVPACKTTNSTMQIGNRVCAFFALREQQDSNVR